MKWFHNTLGIVTAFCLMLIFLITAVEIVAYKTPGYYEREYTKYNVTAAVQMEMPDLLYVTEQMMAYLRGDREDLHVDTIVAGQTREFFNEREIAHMEDVRVLFIGGLLLRQAASILAALCVILMVMTKANVFQQLPKLICIGTGIFFAVSLLISCIISTNFSKYFVVFHEIFFDNDLWILDPRTDLLINIVPEPFFQDTALRIGMVFAGMVIILFFLCLSVLRRKKENQ